MDFKLERKEGNRSLENTLGKINIFISWSQDEAREIALALKCFLEHTNDYFRPWVSKGGIAMGDNWRDEIENSIEQSNFGIIVCTEKSKDAPWVQYESGALHRNLQWCKVAPVLCAIKLEDLSSTLKKSQACTVDQKEELRQLFHDINEVAGSPLAIKEVLNNNFDQHFPEFQKKLSELGF